MEYFISTDKKKIDVVAVHDYLCHRSYWAKGRSLEYVKSSIGNSICFGVYRAEAEMVGFARVVTDKPVFAYLMDLFILEEYQGKGLGKYLAKHIFGHPDFQVRLWFLATKTVHDQYKKFGFTSVDNTEKWMLKTAINRC